MTERRICVRFERVQRVGDNPADEISGQRQTLHRCPGPSRPRVKIRYRRSVRRERVSLRVHCLRLNAASLRRWDFLVFNRRIGTIFLIITRYITYCADIVKMVRQRNASLISRLFHMNVPRDCRE